MRFSRWLLGGFIVLSCVVRAEELKGLPAGGDGAPDGSGESWQLLVAQTPLLEAANELEGLLKAVRPVPQADERPAGYSTIELDVESRTVLLYWKEGESVPAEVSTRLDTLRERGIDVRLRSSAFSAADLERLRDRLLELMLATASEVFVSVGPTPAGSGLTLEVLELTTEVVNAVGQVNSEMESVSAMGRGQYITTKIRPHRFVELQLPTATRENDFPGYWGGSRLIFPGGTGCSSGFAVGSAYGRYLLTAEHCLATVPPVLPRLVYNGGVPIGTAEGPNEELDTARVSVVDAWPRIFDGPLGGEFSKPVVGRSGNFVGAWLCTSGAYSGVRCNIKITAVQEVNGNNRGHAVRELVRAYEVNYASAAGVGDSGGPVFSLSSDPSKVIAHGTISFGDVKYFPAPCTGVIWSNGMERLCSSIFLFTEINNALDHHGVWLATE